MSSVGIWPVLYELGIFHLYSLGRHGKLDGHRVVIRYAQAFFIIGNVTVFESKLFHLGIFIGFLEDNRAGTRGILLEHALKNSRVRSRFNFKPNLTTIHIRRRTAIYTKVNFERSSPVIPYKRKNRIAVLSAINIRLKYRKCKNIYPFFSIFIQID